MTTAAALKLPGISAKSFLSTCSRNAGKKLLCFISLSFYYVRPATGFFFFSFFIALCNSRSRSSPNFVMWWHMMVAQIYKNRSEILGFIPQKLGPKTSKIRDLRELSRYFPYLVLRLWPAAVLSAGSVDAESAPAGTCRRAKLTAYPLSQRFPHQHSQLRSAPCPRTKASPTYQYPCFQLSSADW